MKDYVKEATDLGLILDCSETTAWLASGEQKVAMVTYCSECQCLVNPIALNAYCRTNILKILYQHAENIFKPRTIMIIDNVDSAYTDGAKNAGFIQKVGVFTREFDGRSFNIYQKRC